MLKTRVLVGAIALPILFALILIGGWVFALVVLAALLIGGDEYVRLLRQGSYNAPEWLVLGLIVLAVGTTWYEELDWRDPGLTVLLIVGVFTVILNRERGTPDPLLGVVLAVFGGVYIGWLGSTILAVRMLDDGEYLILLLYGCVIVSDSAAYFVGRQWGQHKLSPRTSPKKTWEGYIGGVVGGVIFGALAASLIEVEGLTVTHGAMIGLLIGVLGTVGDLAISAIKRQVGAKDSGRLFPGHGGMLDRTDSVLVAAAVGYYYLIWFVT
jgi:phosphatidate cytidylyltransferase